MENESGYEAGSEGSLFTSDSSGSDSRVKPKPCDICGSDANELLIITCFSCRERREHTYCARVMLQSVPDMWLCEECRNPSSIRDLANETTSSRTNQVENDDSVAQTAPLSESNQKKPCDICGSDANELLIMTCLYCRETREHIYCARVMIKRIPDMWLCEDCRNPHSIRHLANESTSSRINQVENTMENEDFVDDQTAPLSESNPHSIRHLANESTSSRINQVENTMENEDSVAQTAPLSESNQKKKPCDICGSDANELLIMTCLYCRETREHTYCARVKLLGVPDMWLCEDCRNPHSIRHRANESTSSRINQVGNTMENEDSVDQTPPLSESNQVVDTVIPHVHMYTTSEESTPEEPDMKDNLSSEE